MTFVLRMWWRELRASWARLVFFFLCVGIGVAAVIMLRSVVQNVRGTLTREARSLLAADLVIQSQRPLAGDVRARIDARLAAFGVESPLESIETQTMASPTEGRGNGNVRLVELRGVPAGFPMYGQIDLEGGSVFSHDLVANHGAVVQPALLTALDVRLGDEIRLAGQTFMIRGVVSRDRVQRGGIAFGPRVYIDLADLRQTTLLGFGSRATYQMLARVDEPQTRSLVTDLRAALRQDVVTVRSWQTTEDRIGNNLTVAENYLSLVGFAMVVLGGIGVWSVTRVMVQQKIRSVAILKCIGASSRTVLATYVLQVLSLAGAGAIAGVAIAAAVLAVIPASVVEPLGVSSVSITASAALQGVAVGLLVSLLFAVVPLLEIRRVKPLLLLRADTTSTARQRDWQSLTAGAAVVAALALVVAWQAGSLRAGAWVTGGMLVVATLLVGASRLLVRAMRPLVKSRHFALRHAALGLARPGSQTRVVVMAVGLGCFFVLGIRAIQGNLLTHLSNQVGQTSPDFVLIDVQSDQVATIESIAQPYLRRPARIMPLMRGRVTAIEGRRTHLPTIDDVRRETRLTREFGLTFRSTLEPNERLLSGEFWDSPLGPAGAGSGVDTEVSVERDAARDGRVDIGDLMTFDIAGRRLVARVASVRNVVWDDSQNGGFVFVLRPSPAVEAAAHNYVGFLQVADDPSARAALQRGIVQALPNVSVIDVRDVLNSIRDIVDNVTVGVTVVGAVTLVGGVLILIGAVALTKFQRLYDTAIYRTLGASTRLVGTMIAVEYGLMGLLAGTLGALGALGLSWGLARNLFEIEWEPAPLLLSGGVLVTAVVVGIVGLMASVDVLVRKPLSTLRSE